MQIRDLYSGQPAQGLTDQRCPILQHITLSYGTEIWRLDAEAVASEAGNNVKVDVKDGLRGSRAVSQKEVNALAGETRAADSSGNFHTGLEEESAYLWLEVGEVVSVAVGHYERVPRRYLGNVHER